MSVASARGTNLARWLTALPPNILDARGYHRAIAEAGAQARAADSSGSTSRRCGALGANAFLAVSAANERLGRRHRPPALPPGTAAKRAAPDIALVGKGILFDTGGVNLKPHRSMLDMHTDMAGSAVALATLLALAELRAPIAADAWLAITENHIGPKAYRPQEVVTSCERRHDPGHSYRRRRSHGAGRHAGPRRAGPNRSS